MDRDDGSTAPHRAIQQLLRTARRHLDMDAAFAAELTADEQLYCAVSGTESFTIHEGGSLPRLEGYCQHVFASDAPWVVRDSSLEPRTAELDITSRGRLRAYLGVPLRLPDGRRFGTLCCVDHEPRPDLDERHVAVLRALADLAGHHLALLRDSSERVRTLELVGGRLAGQLRTQERSIASLTRLLDASPTPLAVIDPDDLTVGFANPAARRLLGIGEVDHQPLRTSLAEEDDAALRQLVARLDDDEAAGRLSVATTTAGLRVLELSLQRVGDAPGGPLVVLSGHDVTADRRAADGLRVALDRERAALADSRRLERIRAAFLTAVSHELRTPLTTVRLAAETLAAGRASATQVPLLHERLAVNARRLDRLLVDLLDLNHARRGRLELSREEVRLDELVRRAASQVDLTGHDLDVDLAPVRARVAPTKLERAVVHLLDNAVVHTAPGPILVRLWDEPGVVRLVVEDHGPGIDPAEHERLFMPFEQGATAPAHRPGTGIGLSLVATFVELHDGEVWIEEPAGGGTAVHVRLPTSPSDTG